jgi:hypothetical protein
MVASFSSSTYTNRNARSQDRYLVFVSLMRELEAARCVSSSHPDMPDAVQWYRSRENNVFGKRVKPLPQKLKPDPPQTPACACSAQYFKMM